MLECALFGSSKEKIGWVGVDFERKESVFVCGNTRVVLSVEHTLGSNKTEVTLISRGPPDRNRQRTSVVSEIHKSALEEGGSPEKLLEAMGYTLLNSYVLAGTRYKKARYTLELTKADDDVEYLVKAYVEVDDIIVGEACLDEAYSDLSDFIQLSKPSLIWFE